LGSDGERLVRAGLCKTGSASVFFRLILDIVAPVGGFQFVDAVPVAGRRWFLYVDDI
jgi:hypothetical protein